MTKKVLLGFSHYLPPLMVAGCYSSDHKESVNYRAYFTGWNTAHGFWHPEHEKQVASDNLGRENKEVVNKE
jgi:hypothetical protein